MKISKATKLPIGAFSILKHWWNPEEMSVLDSPRVTDFWKMFGHARICVVNFYEIHIHKLKVTIETFAKNIGIF